ncbi:phage baseplate assembly protein V [Aeromonas veronii]|uniref:phage baseplate assembly protein V n=1 Tax=Aeromonas veronii TaxID=654 RepID=UPI003F37DB24
MSGLQRLTAPLLRRMRLIAGRCMLDAVNDSLQKQNVQVRLLSGESASEVENFQQAGFTSVPLPGAVGLYLATGGKRTSLASFLLENKGRRKRGLKPGEACIYHIGEDDHYFILESGGVARLVCKRFVVEAEQECNFNSPKVTFAKDVTIGGNAAITGTSAAADHMSGGISGKGHTHIDGDGEVTSSPQGAIRWMQPL